MDSQIASFLDEDGFMSARLAPHRARALNSMAFRGQVQRILPGVYVRDVTSSPDEVRLRAIRAYGDDLVVTRHRAAALTWWPDISTPEEWHLACPRAIQPGYGMVVEQRLIPRQLTTRRFGALITAPALTALDLIPELDADPVYEALRRRAVTFNQLQAALELTPKRRGNRRRREILGDCSNAPWSHLERQAHRILRDRRIDGWVANHPVQIRGVTYYLDAAFLREMVALEFDGFEFHSSEQSFHSDRARDAGLAAKGWVVVRFTAQTIDELDATVPELLHRRREQLGR